MHHFKSVKFVLPVGYRMLNPGEKVRRGDIIAYRDGYYGDCKWWAVDTAYHAVGDVPRLVYARAITRAVPNV